MEWNNGGREMSMTVAGAMTHLQRFDIKTRLYRIYIAECFHRVLKIARVKIVEKMFTTIIFHKKLLLC